MLRALTALALASMPMPPSAAPDFDWLVGRWCTRADKGVRTCESWTGWSGGEMRGEGRTSRPGKPVESEAMRIRTAGGKAVYVATPAGSAPVTFAEAARKARSVTFENRGHDYPQRISYWREGRFLVAEISLADGTRAIRWRYRRSR